MDKDTEAGVSMNTMHKVKSLSVSKFSALVLPLSYSIQVNIMYKYSEINIIISWEDQRFRYIH